MEARGSGRDAGSASAAAEQRQAAERLSQRFRHASRKEHKISDSLVAARLIVTATDRRRWAQALASFWYIFAAIEHGLVECSSKLGVEQLAEFLPRVNRAAAFEADLLAFYGRLWREKIPQPSAAVQQYLARVAAITSDSPHRLLAHAYTQHMAILSGGPTIRRSVRASMQLGPEDPGTAAFELQEPAKKLKEEYRALLDGLEGALGAAKCKELVEEHRLVFKLNNEVIRSFPVSPGMTLSGIVRLLPPEALLLLVSALLALIMVALTRTWVKATPDAQDFADPDAVLA